MVGNNVILLCNKKFETIKYSISYDVIFIKVISKKNYPISNKKNGIINNIFGINNKIPEGFF
jgi:hypothetical protein